MNNEQLAEWLRDRWVSEEAIKSTVETADKIKDIYADSVKIGAAMNHEDWLEEIASTGDRCPNAIDQVVWFLLGLDGALISFIELSE